MPPDNSNTSFPDKFHPAVIQWFANSFKAPTPVQTAAWAEITQQERVLISAPTGSGKTLAAFLCAINELVMQSRQCQLADYRDPISGFPAFKSLLCEVKKAPE